MKNFQEWLKTNTPLHEYYGTYEPSLDGPPLLPHTISGAEIQIRHLASNIRTTFGIDPRWQDHKQRIHKVMELLDKAAGLLDDGTMNGEMRNTPHKYHMPD